MQTQIEITGCYKAGIWYSRRIGEVFSATIKNGSALVNNNTFFTIRQTDYVIVPNPNKKITPDAKYVIVLEMIKQRDMILDEIMTQYIKLKGWECRSVVRNLVLYLRERGDIKWTGKKRSGHTGHQQFIWTLNNPQNITE